MKAHTPIYFAANKVAGYSGFVIYWTESKGLSANVWMVPGTFFHDWDNQVKEN